MMPRGSPVKPKTRYFGDATQIKMAILYSRYVELTKGDHYPAFLCDCDYQTSSVGEYHRHLLMEHLESECDENNQVPCPHCEEKFESSRDYRVHFEKTHPNTSRMGRCVLCKFSAFSSRGHYDKIFDDHFIRFHREKFCGIGKGYDDAIIIKKILKDHKKTDKVMREHRDNSYQKRLAVIHDEQLQMCCPHCSFAGDRASFDEHAFIHLPKPAPLSTTLSGQLTVNRDECNSRSPDLLSLKVDMVTEVPLSDSKGPSKTGSKTHRKRRSSESDDHGKLGKKKMYEEHVYDKKTIMTAVKAIKQKQDIKCPFCLSKFPNIGRNLFTHLVNAHLKTERTPEGVIQCSRCTDTFEVESSYRLHFKNHNSQSVGCRQCPFEDSDRYITSNHFIDTHFKELTELSTKKALTNKIGSKVFLDKECIRRRLAEKLEVTKPLKECPFCVYTNESQRGIYNLRQHILVSHLANDRTPAGMIQCPHCDSLFNSDPDFRKHLKKEQSGKGMFCPHCNYIGKTHDQLNSHIRNGHYGVLMPEILLGISSKQASCNRNKKI